MKQFQRVVWSEGMFLTPEHFQASDRAAEQNLEFRFANSGFENWGFTALEINLDKLETGTFEVTSAAGILPDGLAFSMPDNDSLPVCRDLDQNFPGTQKCIDAWLALPAAQPKGANVLLAEEDKAGVNYRYRSRTTPVDDENLDLEMPQSESKSIPLGIRSFRVLFSPPDESLQGFTIMRLARVKRGSTKYSLDEGAVPPLLNLRVNDYLLKILERRVEKLVTSSRTLAQRRQSTLGGTGFANVQDQLLLTAINSFLPGLKHLRNVRMGHPEEAYFQLLNLAGALSSFSSLVDPADLPVYEHKNLGMRFKELDLIIDKILEPPTREKCIEISLEREGLFWVAKLDEERYFSSGEFFLGIKANLTVPDLIRAALKMKIASREGIDQLYRSAVNGLGLQHESGLPAVCAAKNGFQYFRLNKAGPFWNDIQSSGSIGVYPQAALSQAELTLQLAL